MRVAVYYANADVRIEERPRPAAGPDEVLLRIEAAGICGSDVLEWYRIRKAPLVLGHEVAGVVEEVGSGVKRFSPGDRVFATHHVPCGSCRRCRMGHPSTCETLRTTHFDPGGFAEFVRVPALQVEKGMLQLPDSVSFEEGSFIEPLGCVVQGHRFANFRPGQAVLVLGSGLAGLLHIRMARASGAERVWATDVVPARLAAARRFGADEAWDAREEVPARVRSAAGRLADLVVVCAGSPAAIQQAFSCVEPGGTILFFAPTAPDVRVPLPFFDLWRDEVAMVSTYAASGEDLSTALDLIATRKVRVADMITHRLPLSEAARGFRLAAEGKEALKVILEPRR